MDPLLEDDSLFCLIGAMVAAAAAGATAGNSSLGLRDLKVAIDAEATRAAEECLEKFPGQLVVSAGEGAGEGMPGAWVGQEFGRFSRSLVPNGVTGIFDYIDGTTLTAKRLPGALSLGALGDRFHAVPDLQAYVAMLPSEHSAEFDIMTSMPEDHALEYLDLVSKLMQKPRKQMTVLTHSTDSGSYHDDLISVLRSAHVGRIIVPNPVMIEATYFLGLAGLGADAFDSMLSVCGLPEIAFVCALIDVLNLPYRLAIRLASLDAKTRGDWAHSLAPFFEFSEQELTLFEACGLSVDQQYSSVDLVAPGSCKFAVAIAVTENKRLALEGVRQVEGSKRLNGFMLRRGDAWRLDVMMKESDVAERGT